MPSYMMGDSSRPGTGRQELKWHVNGRVIENGPPSKKNSKGIDREITQKKFELQRTVAEKNRTAEALDQYNKSTANILSDLTCGMPSTNVLSCGELNDEPEELEDRLKVITARQHELQSELDMLTGHHQKQVTWEEENVMAAACGCFAMPCVNVADVDNSQYVVHKIHTAGRASKRPVELLPPRGARTPGQHGHESRTGEDSHFREEQIVAHELETPGKVCNQKTSVPGPGGLGATVKVADKHAIKEGKPTFDQVVAMPSPTRKRGGGGPPAADTLA